MLSIAVVGRAIAVMDRAISLVAAISLVSIAGVAVVKDVSSSTRNAIVVGSSSRCSHCLGTIVDCLLTLIIAVHCSNAVRPVML